MAVNADVWMKEYGRNATIRIEQARNASGLLEGFDVLASYYRANPARVTLHRFKFEESAQQYVALLKQQYQPHAAPRKKGR